MATKLKPRQIERLGEIADAAIDCFGTDGFRRAQVADIARACGLSPGTLYLYAESKEALLHLAILRLSGANLEGFRLPLLTPDPSETEALVEKMARERANWPALKAALAAKGRPGRDALETIGAELYDLLKAESRAMRLLDHCAVDLPTLARIHAEHVRGLYLVDLIALVSSPKRRNAAPLGDTKTHIAVRGAIELMAWSAMHRHREPELVPDMAEDEVRAIAARCFAACLEEAMAR